VFVSSAEELRALDPSAGERVLGLLNRSHLAFEHDRDDAEEPSLAEMTRFAIESLSTNENGYYLMVEAGRVDHAHHGVNAYRAMTDMVALADAVRAAEEMTDPDETLMIVTADHSHVFTIAGYPRRGQR
jgi:alkaline phosphatase